MKITVTVTPNASVPYEVPDWLFRKLAVDLYNQLIQDLHDRVSSVEEITVTVSELTD